MQRKDKFITEKGSEHSRQSDMKKIPKSSDILELLCYTSLLCNIGFTGLFSKLYSDFEIYHFLKKENSSLGL